MKRMLLGVGNRLSRDDGAGPVLAERLAGSDWTAIDCGTSLENVGGVVARERPGLLVIADAARMGLRPGAVRRLPRPSVDRMLATTHGLPLKFFLDRLASVANEVVLLGIEPADLSLGEGLSTEVGRAVDRLAEALAAGGRRGIASVRFLGGRRGRRAHGNGPLSRPREAATMARPNPVAGCRSGLRGPRNHASGNRRDCERIGVPVEGGDDHAIL